MNENSVKMYDKEGTVLRVETTINEARDMKVFRPKESTPAVRNNGDPCAKVWRICAAGRK